MNEGVTSAARPVISPVWLVLAGIVSVQVGASAAKSIFGVVEPATLAWLRVVTAAVVLVAFVRPQLRGHTRRDWLVIAGYAIALVGMNVAIYLAMARIPLGIAVTIEFLGPLAVAVLGSRRLVDFFWVLLAAAGVVLLGVGPQIYGALTGHPVQALDPIGIVWALVAGAGWAGYILLGGPVGRRWSGLSGLVVAFVVGAIVLTPVAVVGDHQALTNPVVLVIGVVVGLMSSVVPYSLELIALRRIKPSTFGILMSLEPAAAAVAAMLILQEWLTPMQLIAMGLVVAASIGAGRRAAGGAAD